MNKNNSGRWNKNRHNKSSNKNKSSWKSWLGKLHCLIAKRNKM